MESSDVLLRVADWLRMDLDADRLSLLHEYASWLTREALPAGGIGPREGERIYTRHLGDSLCFAAGWRDCEPPTNLLDVGSGVGLPGIPLAILWDRCQVRLAERSGRRVDLLARAIRVLGLENLDLEPKSWESAAPASGVTMRAVLPPERWSQLTPLIGAGGRAVIGAGQPEHGEGLGSLVTIPEWVLERPAWLRIMEEP